MVAVEQRRVMWPAGNGINHEGTKGTKELGIGGTLNAQRSTLNATWEVLTAEMRRYEYEIGPTGQVSYAAPSGYHDDCVMALALAVWGCRTYGAEPGRMMRLGGNGVRTEDRSRRVVTLA